jgi:predicted DNA-binding protein (MmcQ/YjbR family)
MIVAEDYGPWLGRMRGLCQGYPQAEAYVMVHHPAFRVGKKPFAILGSAGTLSVKVAKEAQPAYLEDPRITKTPYIGQHGWITLDWAKFEDAEIRALVELSYAGVAPKRKTTKPRP